MTTVAELESIELEQSRVEVLKERVDTLNRLLGERDRQVEQLQAQLVEANGFRDDAIELRRMRRWATENAEWCLDQRYMNGVLSAKPIDAALGGNEFVPCETKFIVDGKKYRNELVSTEYQLVEIDE